MTAVAVLLGGVGVFLVVAGSRASVLADRLSVYLLPSDPVNAEPTSGDGRRTPAWAPWVAAGGLVGTLAAQGDLFIAGPGRSVPALAALGGLSGFVLWSMRRTNREQARADRLRCELPIVCDMLALHVVAGASISGSMEQIVDQMDGVAVEELHAVLERIDAGDGVERSLLIATRTTAHPDARRLYDLLGHAHESGGKLARMLAELALDFRASLERDLVTEGGRRAVTSYGPILALMVPTALLFLLYPTIVGLKMLAGGP